MKRLTIIFFLGLAGCGGSPEKAPAPSAASPAAPRPADESAAIHELQLIHKAQSEYIKRYRRYALTYEELIDARLIAKEPSAGTTGFEIKLRPAPDAGSYRIFAEPVSPDPSTRHFFTDQTGVIRAEQGKEATAASPQV